MTSPVVSLLCRAFVGVLRESGVSRPRLLLARDGRASGTELLRACKEALTACGCDCEDLGIVATPTAGFMVEHTRAHGAVVITASHNPIEWNGIKFIDSSGAAPAAALARRIITRFQSGLAVPDSSADCRGVSGGRDDADSLHVARVLSLVDRDAIASARIHATIDSCNGGGSRSGCMLLESLGVSVTQIHGEPLGYFERTPEPIEANLSSLCQAVAHFASSGAGAASSPSVGFAQDPDADRLALVDERGRFVGEEYTLALCAQRILQRVGSATLATNLSSSRMIDDVALQFPPSSVRRTAVGEAHVVAALRECDGAIGGEGNGGVIWPAVCSIRDSLGAMALVLESMALSRLPLSQLVAGIPQYTMIKRKMNLADAGGAAAVQPALARVCEAYAGERIDRTDGVRIDLACGWVHLRASNTEPIIRLIAEAKDAATAQALCVRCARVAGLRL